MWLVTKKVAPLGWVFKTYLRHPRRGFFGSQGWDERHDARQFTFLQACYQAIRHFAWIEKA